MTATPTRLARRARSPRIWGALAASLALAAPALAAPAAARAAEVIAVSFPQGAMQRCSDPVTGRFSVQGPGPVTVTVVLKPYKSLGQVPNIPVRWWPVGPGIQDFSSAHPLPGLERTVYLQAGHEVRNFVDGAPLTIENHYVLPQAKTYLVDVRAYPQCSMMPQKTYWQEGQEVHVGVSSAGAATASTAPSAAHPPVPTPPPAGVSQPMRTLFSTLNTGSVINGPTRPTIFTLARSARIVKLTTYRWNDGRGAAPGSIGLRSARGQVFGPWRAAGIPGQGGVPNAQWVVSPGVTLPPGTYTVIDSSPATWAQNAVSGGAGMAWADGYFN